MPRIPYMGPDSTGVSVDSFRVFFCFCFCLYGGHLTTRRSPLKTVVGKDNVLGPQNEYKYGYR